MADTEEKTGGASDEGLIDLVRKVISFQFKLLADGLRDLFLSPISIGAAILGIVTRPDDPHYYFRRLMAFGLRTDRWINLFGLHDHEETGEASSDALLKNVEKVMVDEYRKQLNELNPDQKERDGKTP